MLREYMGPRAPAFRAPRHSIELPIRYRTPDAPAWHEGRTENISSSGVLIRTRELLPTHTPIDMLLSLPAEVGGRGVPVICRGRVVRAEPAAAAGGSEPAMAATIIAVRYIHPPDADPRRI
jgi:PilZ domain